jgi:putative addiction module CopG family antidote
MVDNGVIRGEIDSVKVSLPAALEDFVSGQVRSGEFGDASAVVSEAVRLMREAREKAALEEMQAAFGGVDGANGEGQPTTKDRALIDQLIKSHRAGKRR